MVEIGKRKYLGCKIGCLVVLLLFVSASVGYCVWRNSRTLNSVIKNNWGIDLPKNLEEVYSVETPPFDSEIYTVLLAKVEPTDFLEDFERGKSEQIKAASEIIILKGKFTIPGNLLPKWEETYYWKHVGKSVKRDIEPLTYWHNMYMIYFPDSMRLIIFQDFV